MTVTRTRLVSLADGASVEVRLTGDGPVPVVALAGGAAASIDFFPGIRDLLGATVVEHDRVDTGRTPPRASGPATLGAAAADLHALRLALDLPPVVVVAQSFGGAVWAQWLADHPDDIAGAVVIDPTPINDPHLIEKSLRPTRVISFLLTAPIVRLPFNALMASLVRKDADMAHPDIDAALAALLEPQQWRRLVRQFEALPEQAAALRDRLVPHLGQTLVIGAERKDRGSQKGIRAAHEELCRKTGARYELWPDAVHTEHLRRPRQVMAAVQSVIDGIRREDV